ncbi:thioredoxin [Lachnoclostridium sp. Marseille-P6806]|uniref:thioredoxin n=1 Tax=Lachnoclostridium sp. Marseille-P6806 TaxID=2364793 RepID=UPI0010310591
MRFDSANFEHEVLQSELPVLVDFYADWCGPCKMMAPVVEQLAGEYEGKILVGQLNVDDNPDIAEKYSVMSIPTFLIFRGGKVVDTAVGAIPRSTLEEKIRGVIGA